MNKQITIYKRENFNTDICYCNSENIVACAYQTTNKCPRVCKLFDDNLEEMFIGNNKWREDEK